MRLYAAALNFRRVAEEFRVPTDFSPAVHKAAAAARDRFAARRRDARDLPFVTVDPPGSRDLDQAVCITRRGDGYRVRYAIADVAAFVAPGGAVEAESLRRGQTIYLPDEPARLHPAVLSEGSASLLPGVDRPAVLWTMDLDAAGEVEDVSVERALVRSRAQLDYDSVHAATQVGQAPAAIALLGEVGRLRQASSLRRDAVNLRIPSQRVRRNGDGRYELVIEPRHPVMDYNSEISLLTGMCAGQMMVSAGQGPLRTLRPAGDGAEEMFRQEARALGYRLADDDHVGHFLAGVDADAPAGMAVMREAQKLLRGAGYGLVDDGGAEVHAGIGGYYAHVTAPLRRLIDRFAAEYCLAISGGYEPPAWATQTVAQAAGTMSRTSQLANTVDRACLNLTEATVLAPWLDHNFAATVLHSDRRRGHSRIFVHEPPVLAHTLGNPADGTRITASLIKADTDSREVLFAWPAD